MIAIVVVTTIIEKFISSIAVLRKLEVKRADIYLLKDIGKTAVCALLAGIFTFLFYWQLNAKLAAFGTDLAQDVFGFSKTSVIDLVSGVLVLGACFLIFTPIYLLSANFFGIIDDDEKKFAGEKWTKLTKIFKPKIKLTQDSGLKTLD